MLYKLKHKLIISLAGIISLFFASCSPFASITLSVLEPAQISLPKEINAVTIAPKFSIDTLPNKEFSRLDNLKFQDDNYYPLMLESLPGLAETLGNSPKYSRIVIREDNIPELTDNLISPADWTNLVKICRDDSTDAIIVMVDAQYSDSIDVSAFDFGFGCRAYYSIKSSILWYVLYPKEIKIVDTETVNDKAEWDEVEISCDYALALLPEIPNLIGNACYNAGVKYGEMIAPQWNEQVKRKYYKSGHRKLREGYYNMLDDNYLYAAELWRSITDFKRSKVAARACFNMAIINEMNDNLDVAKDWAVKSNTLEPDPIVLNYIKVLNKRIEDKEKINKQL